jgi:Dolichyl-phosphate-mannose-protein mannosyltransferase
MTFKQALWTLIGVSALIRLFCAFSLGLGNDEAYHFLYAAHPALSYYDHPPMMAWVEMLGLALSTGGAPSPSSSLTLRVGFIVLFAGSTWLLARVTTRYYGDRAGFLAALALNVTGYYGLAASTFALPDGPLLFFWILCIDRLSVALEDPERGRVLPWVWVGLAWGGAMLSKYHGVFIPLGALLYILLEKSMRRWLFRSGPYLAISLGLVLFSPVILWNARHGWVSFLFQGGRAVGSAIPRPDYLATALFGQAMYLFPWIWVPLVIVLVNECRAWSRGLSWDALGRPTLLPGGAGTTPVPRDALLTDGAGTTPPDPPFARGTKVRDGIGVNTRPVQDEPFVSLGHSYPERLWLCLAIVPLGVINLVACFRPALPHWGLIGLVSLLPILGRNWSQRMENRPEPTRRLMVAFGGFSLVFLCLTIVEFRYGFLQSGREGQWGLIDAQKDPTLDLYGWDQVAERINQLGLVDQPGTFVFTHYWYQSAQLAYALNGKRPVLCYNADDPRGFAFWSRPEDWVGRDGVLVVVGEPDLMAGYYGRWFAHVERVADFWVERNGKPVRRIELYRCGRQRVAYPFAMDRPVRIAQSSGGHEAHGGPR